MVAGRCSPLIPAVSYTHLDVYKRQGLCNFYRKFQRNYAQTTARLSAVLQKNKQWKWGENEREAFCEIKNKFANMILMNHPNFNNKFYLQTDASNIALGAELYQEDEAKEHHTIAFANRTLLASERNYTRCV